MSEIILVRGLFRGKFHWGRFPELLRQALPDFCVMCYDIPGNGELSEDISPNSIEGMVESLRSQRISTKPVNLLCISMGGMIGIKWAQMYPKEIISLVCINTSAGNSSPIYHRLRPSNYLKILTAIFKSSKGRETTIYNMVANQPLDHKVIAKWVTLSETYPIRKSNFFRQLFAAMTFKATRPQCPIIFLASAKDRLVSVQASKKMAQQWGAPLIINPHDGHDIPLDNPQWVCQQLADIYDVRDVS